MLALKVFAASIGYLRKHMVDAYGSRTFGIDDIDIKWVLTVPAIWDDAAKQFMREAAEMVRMSEKKLYLFYVIELPLVLKLEYSMIKPKIYLDILQPWSYLSLIVKEHKQMSYYFLQYSLPMLY